MSDQQHTPTKAPFIPPAVVTWLEGVFPDRLPDTPLPPDEIGMCIGAQKVIRKLRHEIKKQERQGSILG